MVKINKVWGFNFRCNFSVFLRERACSVTGLPKG